MIRYLTDQKLTVNGLRLIRAAGLSTDEKPAQGIATGSVFVEVDTGNEYRWDEDSGSWCASGGEALSVSRISSLDDTPLHGGNIIEAVGIPAYLEDVTDYSAWGLTENGWYIFARIAAQDGVTVTAQTTVTGAAGYLFGANYVDVAVKFEVAALSKVVVVDWVAYTDTFVFRATDLAVRNLDYRTTFYIYDLSPYVTWSYALTSDATFVAGSHYYTESGGEYTEAVEGTDWTAGDAVPAYYTEDDGAYTQATGVFQDGVTYYTKSGDVYSEAVVTVGAAIPAYYKHSKLHLEGMTRNITYRFDEIVDCPSEIMLPVIEDDTHGCWFEFQMRHGGAYSMTLLPPEGVKVATEHTQAETAGMNMIDLHYMNIDGVKLWRFLNTHSTIPTT